MFISAEAPTDSQLSLRIHPVTSFFWIQEIREEFRDPNGWTKVLHLPQAPGVGLQDPTCNPVPKTKSLERQSNSDCIQVVGPPSGHEPNLIKSPMDQMFTLRISQGFQEKRADLVFQVQISNPSILSVKHGLSLRPSGLRVDTLPQGH